MKKILTLLVVTLTLITAAQAQRPDGSIKGKLMDTAAKAPISDATVSVLRAKDSSLVTYTLSNKQGVFEIKGLEEGDYRLVISHNAYGETKQTVTVSTTNKQVDLGSLAIQKDYKTLGEVVVKSEAPIQVKNDTVQFNASGFKTPP